MADKHLSPSEVASKLFHALSDEIRQKLIDGLSNVGVGVERPQIRQASTKGSSEHASQSNTTGKAGGTHLENDVITINDSDSGEEDSKTGFESSKEEVSSAEDSVSDEEKEASDSRHLTLPKNAGSESDDEWECIKIEDDSDDDSRKRDTPNEMVCLRCPNKTAGSFKDKEKFWIHIKRHTFGSHFTCRTCRRPFVKLSHCISHEIRVHGTKLEYDNRDGVISMAKAYVRKKELTKKNATTNPNTQQENPETDVETDSEDSKFYDNQVVSSTSMYPYRGPEVQSILESYEIQFNHARQKYSRANLVARIALDVHDHNVELGNSCLSLGRFSKSKKKPAKKNCKRKKKANNVRPSDKRQAESAIEKSEQPKQKRRKIVRYQYITSSSSSSSSSSEDDNPDDVDYEPSRDKSRRYESDGNSKDIMANGNSSQNKVRIKRAPANLSRPKFRFLSGIMKRVCQQCNYMWTDEADLRVHRDTRHPNLPLMDLMEVDRIKQKPSKKARKVGDSCGLASNKKHGGQQSSAVGEAGINVVAAGPSGQNRNGKRRVENIANANIRAGLESSSGKNGNKGSRNKSETNASNKKDSRKKANEKKKSKSNRMQQRMQLVPVPDSTFTEKEKFLHALGLTNRIRLDLLKKKPIKDLDLPECYVELERLNPQLSKSNFQLWFEKPLWELVTWDDSDFPSSK